MDPRNYIGVGPDPYSEEHPRGAFNRAMRDNTRMTRALGATQPLGNDRPAAESDAPEPQPAAQATTQELADAIADAIERKNHKPTLQETMRENTRKLLQLSRERDERHVDRARQMIVGDAENGE
jgi:hypothetical protein